MQRAVALGLGVGLVFMAFGGLVYGAPIWLVWLDGVAGLMAFAGAGAFGTDARAAAAVWGALGLGLVALWLGGLRSSSAGSMPWGNFGFACAFLFLAVSSVVAPARTAPGARVRS